MTCADSATKECGRNPCGEGQKATERASTAKAETVGESAERG